MRASCEEVASENTGDHSPSLLRSPRLGAHYLGDGRCEIAVWAPRANKVELKIGGPQERWPTLKTCIPVLRMFSGWMGQKNGLIPRPDTNPSVYTSHLN